MPHKIDSDLHIISTKSSFLVNLLGANNDLVSIKKNVDFNICLIIQHFLFQIDPAATIQNPSERMFFGQLLN